MKTILVIDDQPVSRASLGQFLFTTFPDIKLLVVGNLQEFGSQDDALVFEVVVISPGQTVSHFDTLRLIENVVRQFPQIPLMLYGCNVDANDISFYFQVGVWGYVSKNNEHEEVATCITSLLNRKKFISDQTLRLLFGDTCDSRATNEVRCPVVLDILSPRQLEIAQLLCSAYRIADIARQLSVNSSTVSNTKAVIFQKLGVKSVEELARRLSAASRRTRK